MPAINFNEPSQVAYKASTATSTAGVTLATVTDLSHLRKSQLTLYVTADLTGGITGVKFYVYFSPDYGTTYLPAPIISTSTGICSDVPVEITSASYSLGSNIYGAVVDIPMSGTTALRIVGVSTSGTPPVVLWVLTRDN